jgi:6-phosphogluconolactonase
METISKYKPNIKIAPDAETLARQTVDLFVTHAQESIKSKNLFHVAISGGYTPKLFFEFLGQLPEVKALHWGKIELFWVDERIVRPDSQWSNYKLAADTFLTKVPIPQENIHQIPTEHSDFKIAAKYYEETIRKVFGLEENQLPEFDLILLGMGADGHTASMFPNSYASFDTENLACVVYVLDEKQNRITLTHPVLLAASHLAVLVSGEEKAEILQKVLTSEPDEIKYPIHVLWPVLDKVTWLVDKQAAKFL